MTHLRQIMLEELRHRNYPESNIHAMKGKLGRIDQTRDFVRVEDLGQVQNLLLTRKRGTITSLPHHEPGELLRKLARVPRVQCFLTVRQ